MVALLDTDEIAEEGPQHRAHLLGEGAGGVKIGPTIGVGEGVAVATVATVFQIHQQVHRFADTHGPPPSEVFCVLHRGYADYVVCDAGFAPTFHVIAIPVTGSIGQQLREKGLLDGRGSIHLFSSREEERPLRVAVVGRPNVGKSTLINRLLGEERLLTGPEAGITRDAIALEFTWDGRKFLLHDTAGIRRRPKVQEKLEKLSVADALNAIRYAEVAVLLMDARRPFEEQDLRIADLVEREGRALVIGMSMWDIAERKPGTLSRLRAEADHRLAQLKGVPVIAVSGLTGEGLERLMQAVIEAHAVWNKRVPTAALNRFLQRALADNPPPTAAGRPIKLNYLTQPKSRPPSFVLFGSRADAVPDSYLRYLVNGLRETFGLPGTPIRITLREKKNPFANKRR